MTNRQLTTVKVTAWSKVTTVKITTQRNITKYSRYFSGLMRKNFITLKLFVIPFIDNLILATLKRQKKHMLQFECKLSLQVHRTKHFVPRWWCCLGSGASLKKVCHWRPVACRLAAFSVHSVSWVGIQCDQPAFSPCHHVFLAINSPLLIIDYFL